VNEGNIGDLSSRIYSTITNIQNGELEDTLGWTTEVKA
jgi:branched-chain amino acid aminotransferase